MKTEYLILHENEINWEELSKDPDRSFSLAEIRMFRKRINWIEYLKCHNMSHDEMEVASKHFNEDVYDFIALNNLADQEFIQNHLKDFKWSLLTQCHYLTQETLLKAPFETISKELALEYIEKNKLFNIYDGSYDEFLVYMDLKDA